MAVVTTVLFGLAPALRVAALTRPWSMKDGSGDARPAARGSGSGMRSSSSRWPWPCVLLIGAGLTLRRLWALERADLGLEPSGDLTMRMALPVGVTPSPSRSLNFYSRLNAQLRQNPWASAQAGAARSLPLGSPMGDSA